MFDKLVGIGIDKGQGIFFFLFLAALGMGWFVFRFTMKAKDKLVEDIMVTNNQREERYISTIDKLADVHEIKTEMVELRKDLNASNERQERMLGRVLDRLPSKSGE